jgi:hypothetical protein
MLDLSAISIKTVVEYLWTALGVYFLASALLSKRPREPEAALTPPCCSGIRLRHPIYAGILTALMGTELVYGQWRFIIGFVTVRQCSGTKPGPRRRFWLGNLAQNSRSTSAILVSCCHGFTLL